MSHWTRLSDSTPATWADSSSATAFAWNDNSSATAASWADSSAATSLSWTDDSSAESYRWIPLGKLTDLWGGVDFIPKATAINPYKATTDRPIAARSASSVTGAGHSSEGIP